MKLFGRKQPEQPQRVEPVIDAAKTEETARSPSISNSMSMSDFNEWVRGVNNAAGMAVNERTAMNIGAVYASVSLIGGGIAQTPLPVFERDGAERKRVYDSDIGYLLNEQPHPNLSAAVFWESFTGSLLLNGDGFARIMRPSRFSPNIIGFDWYKKSEVEVKKDGDYLIYLLSRDGKTEAVMADDMLHVPGPGFDGKNGMSQIKHALRNSAGIALAADTYSSKFFENGARPDIALEVPGSPGDNEIRQLRESWMDRHSGPSNAHLPAILSGGMKAHELTMNAEDAQLISTRQFQVEDIARIFGVPPHMIGHTQNTTSWGSGVEQMSIGFVKYTLARHLRKIEQEINRKIWRGKKYFVEFNTAGLERGDYKTRNEGYRIAAGRAGEPAWMTINEIRKLENLPPVEGGNELFKGQTNESTPETTGTE